MDKNTFVNQVLEAEKVLYRIAKSMLLREQDCEDAVQNAILKAYEKLNSLREEHYFKTWITRILINECYSVQRADKGQLSYEDYFENESLHAASPSAQDNRELYWAIAQLKPKIKSTIVLHYIEGYGVDEIAKILKVPAGTVKSRLSKGRQLLKTTLISMEVCYEQAEFTR